MQSIRWFMVWNWLRIIVYIICSGIIYWLLIVFYNVFPELTFSEEDKLLEFNRRIKTWCLLLNWDSNPSAKISFLQSNNTERPLRKDNEQRKTHECKELHLETVSYVDRIVWCVAEWLFYLTPLSQRYSLRKW